MAAEYRLRNDAQERAVVPADEHDLAQVVGDGVADLIGRAGVIPGGECGQMHVPHRSRRADANERE